MNKDYSNKDIRGKDFSNDDLTNANFQNATAGISPNWERVLKILSCFLAFFAGLTSAYSGAIIAHIITNDADFTGASLYYTDFLNANLTSIRWDDVKGLESARRETINTYQTLDLALKDTINPNTVAIALQQLSEKYPLELSAIEGKSQQEIRFHVKMIEMEHQRQLSQELNQIYRELAVLSPNNSGDNLDERNPTIRILKELLEQAIDTPKNYFNTEGKFNMTQGKGNVSISGTQGNVSGVAAAGENQTFTGVALGEISGNVTNTINQLPDVSTSDQPNIKDLLTQLQTAIENEQDLDEDDKSQALEQVKTIAEAAQNPQDTKMQKLAKGAKNTLSGIMSNLPTATKLVEQVNNLLPIILKIFGL